MQFDYSKTYFNYRKTESLLKEGNDYLLYPLGTTLFKPYGKKGNVREFEIYGIELCAAGVFYHVTNYGRADEDCLKSYSIPESEIGKSFLLEIPSKKENV